VASAGTDGLPRRALDDFLESSNTESNDKEPAQSSSLETAPLLLMLWSDSREFTLHEGSKD
jgi:hypothetical protein